MALNEIRKPTIEEMLANTSVAKLKELAKDYYVKGYSKLNKAALVEVVSSALQKPKHLTNVIKLKFLPNTKKHPPRLI